MAKVESPDTAKVELRIVAPDTVRVEPNVVAPEIEAVPPTSKVVLVSPPALIPSLELVVISRLEDIETPEVKVVRLLKVQAPVTDSFWDREAGPPTPQSKVIKAWD